MYDLAVEEERELSYPQFPVEGLEVEIRIRWYSAVWDRWKGGDDMHAIAASLDVSVESVRETVVKLERAANGSA